MPLQANAQTAPYAINVCPSDRLAQGIGNCSANDIRIASITVTNGVSSCTAGSLVQLDLDITIQVGAQARYDVGLFIAQDGKTVDLKAAQGGSASCRVEALPTSLPWANLNANVCGDVSAATGTQTVSINGGSYLCATDGSGQLILPGMVTWSQNAATSCPASLPAGFVSSQYVEPGGPSKCNINSTTASPPIAVRGSITVNKSVVGPNGTFNFSGTGFSGAGSGEPPFAITTAAGSGSHVVSGLVIGNTYTITEGASATSLLTNLACTGGSVTTNLATRTATVTLTSAEPNVACTFTNAATGSLTVVKNSPGGNDTFSFSGSAALGAPFTVTTSNNTGSRSTSGLAAGSYVVTEGALPAGWQFTNLSCSDSTAGSTFAISGTTANINFAAGGTVTCTYTNTKLGSITINKSTVNGNGSFAFTGSAIAPFSIATAGFSGSHTIANLAPGANYTVTETAQSGWDLTTLSCSAGGTANLGTRTVSIAGLQPGANVTCTFSNTQQADLSITKTDGTTTLAPGATTAYVIVVSNAGPGAADGAVVTDPAAAGLSKTGTPACVASGGAVCPGTLSNSLLEGAGAIIPTLPAGGSVTFTVAATVTASSGSVTNTAAVAMPAGLTDPALANNSASDTDTIALAALSADLAVAKTNGVGVLLPGASTTYVVTVSNLGSAAAPGAIVTDPAVAGLAKTGTPGCVANGGAACPATVSNALFEGPGVVIPIFPAGGSVVFTLTAMVTAPSGSVTNTAAVASPAGISDPDLTNNSASDTDAIAAPVVMADLVITKTNGVATLATGATTTYTIVASNLGPAPADGAPVSDPLVVGLVKTGTPTCSASGGAACPATLTNALLEAGGVVIPTLPVGGSVTITITANVVAASGSVTNTATVAPPAGVTDPVAANNSASDTDTVTVVAATADLAITKTDGITTVSSGGSTTYTIVASNSGPNAANGAVVADPAATGLAKTGTPTCAASGGAACPATLTNALLEGAGVVIPTLPVGGSVTITITANVVAASGSVTNTATVAPPAGVTDPVAANNSASDTDTVTAVAATADLAITKTDGITTVSSGGSTTYTIVTSNSGPNAANGATVTDPAAAGLAKTGTPTCAASGGAACPATLTNALLEGAGVVIPTLPVGGSVTITITANVVAASGSVTNTATVAAPAGVTDPALANNSASDTDTVTAVAATADLAITKTDGITTVSSGGSTTYTIVASNSGPNAANGATVTDPAAAGLAKTGTPTCSASGGAACPATLTNALLEGTGVVIPTLPVGGSVTITITANVVAASGSVTNTATVTAPAGVTDPALANNSASDTDTAVAAGVVAQPVPTLGGWMMILMGLLLLGMGGHHLRRR